MNVLITSPVLNFDKLKRVAALSEISPDVAIVVDSIEGANLLNEQINGRLGVYVDLDPGMGRTGITPGPDAIALVHHIIDNCSSLSFAGLQMYIGNCMHIAGYEARRSKYTYLLQKGIAVRDQLIDEGIPVPVFSGGGTGTFDIEPGIGALTELQAGSYVFMDVEYRDIGDQEGEQFMAFPPSLFVLTSAISKPQERLITTDAGIKSLATDTAYPEFRDVEGVKYHFGGDEHGIVQLNNPSREIHPGDRLQVITPHCDPTVNLYDYYYPYRDGQITELWPISARGCSQ